MVLNVVCPKGHRLTAKSAHAGRRGRCPVCSDHVIIPDLRPTSSALSDTGALRILGDYCPPEPRSTAPQPALTSNMRPAQRCCPRCETPLPHNFSVCEHCQTFVGRR
jgi:hypothetical protein